MGNKGLFGRAKETVEVGAAVIDAKETTDAGAVAILADSNQVLLFGIAAIHRARNVHGLEILTHTGDAGVLGEAMIGAEPAIAVEAIGRATTANHPRTWVNKAASHRAKFVDR